MKQQLGYPWSVQVKDTASTETGIEENYLRNRKYVAMVGVHFRRF